MSASGKPGFYDSLFAFFRFKIIHALPLDLKEEPEGRACFV
jgi:hypothetical protein